MEHLASAGDMRYCGADFGTYVWNFSGKIEGASQPLTSPSYASGTKWQLVARQGRVDLLGNISSRLVCLQRHHLVGIVLDDLQQATSTGTDQHRNPVPAMHLRSMTYISQHKTLTGVVWAWNADRRAFSVSALSSLRLISGSPVMSSTPACTREQPCTGAGERPLGQPVLEEKRSVIQRHSSCCSALLDCTRFHSPAACHPRRPMPSVPSLRLSQQFGHPAGQTHCPQKWTLRPP